LLNRTNITVLVFGDRNGDGQPRPKGIT